MNYGEYEIENNGQEAVGQETREALTQTTSGTLERPLPDTPKRLIRPEVINSWSFEIRGENPSIAYRLLKYALVTCPRLQYLEIIESVNLSSQIQLSPSQKILPRYQIDESNPLGTSQDHLKYIRFDGFPLTQRHLDLMANFLPYVESIVSVDQHRNSNLNITRQLTSITFNLTAFEKLKVFRIDLQTLVDCGKRKVLDYLLFHFKLSNGVSHFTVFIKRITTN